MALRDQVYWVLKTLISEKRRSLLTVLGFAVGISAVALLSSLGEGVRLYLMKEFTQFGSHILAVTPGKADTLGISSLLNTVRPISLEDANALAQLPEVESVVPVVMGNAQVKTLERGRYTDVAGVGSEALQGWQLSMAEGSFLPDDDWFQARPTAVLGFKVKQELFGNNKAVGELVQIGGSRFRVVGVTAEKGQLLGFDMDDIVYIPTQRGLQLFNRESLMEIDLFYRPGVSSQAIAQRVRQLLIQRHGGEDFTIVTQDEMLKTLDNILQVIKAAAAGLGVISLLVGGVGILTILLITVSERKREIGLLCALGFTPNQIRNLFLSEAIALSLVGAGLGLGFVITLIVLAQLFAPGIPLSLDWFTIFIALLIAAIIGWLAGVQPASSAAKLKPIDALRSE